MSPALDIPRAVTDTIEHVGMLLAAGFLLSHLLPLANRRGPLARSALLGVVFSLLALMSLLSALEPLPGVYLDARLAPLTLAGAVAGWPAAAMSFLISFLYRGGLGGQMIGPAGGSIVMATAIGLLYWHWRGRRRQPMRLSELLLLAAANVAQLAAWITVAETLRPGVAGVLSASLLPAEFGALVLLGVIFSDQQRRDHQRQVLRRSEQRLQRALSATQDAVFEVDYERCRQYLGPQLNRILSYPDHAVLNFDELIHPEDRQLEQRLADEHLAGVASHYEAEFRLRAADDRWVWCLARGRVVKRGADGRPQLWIGTIADISLRKRTQQALMRSEARWRSLVENADAYIGLLDPGGLILFLNRAPSGGATSVLGRSIFDLVPPDCVDPVRAALTEVVQAGRPQRLEIHDLRDRWYVCQLAPVREEGQVVAVVTIASEITDRKLTELRIRHQRDRAQAYLDVAAVMIVAIGPDERVQLANRRAAELLGCVVEQIVGQNWFDRFLPDAEREKVRATFHGILAGELKLVETFENAVRCADGRERTIEWHNALLYDVQGQVAGTISSGLDVTERRAAERALRDSEARYRSLVETREELILRLRRDGQVTFANEGYCRFLGQPRDAVVGQRYDARAHPDDQQAADDLLRDVERPPGRVSREHRARAGEAWRWIAWESSAIHDEDGRVTEIQLVGRDITKRKDAEAQARDRLMQLARISRLNTIGEMAATFAHELNQPLTAIINYAGAARNRLEREPAVPRLTESGDMMGRIITQAQRASELVYRVRNYVSRGTSSAASVGLNELVAEAAEFVRPEARRAGAAVHTELDDRLPPVVVDRLQIEQVLVNLMLNAIDAMGELPGRPHHLWVRTRADHQAGEAVVSISDSGPGVAADDLQRIFEPFVSSKNKGMGLGLSISRSIVQAAGGRLWAEHREEGGFFAFSLPVESNSTSGRAGRAAPPDAVDPAVAESAGPPGTP